MYKRKVFPSRIGEYQHHKSQLHLLHIQLFTFETPIPIPRNSSSMRSSIILLGLLSVLVAAVPVPTPTDLSRRTGPNDNLGVTDHDNKLNKRQDCSISDVCVTDPDRHPVSVPKGSGDGGSGGTNFGGNEECVGEECERHLITKRDCKSNPGTCTPAYGGSSGPNFGGDGECEGDDCEHHDVN